MFFPARIHVYPEDSSNIRGRMKRKEKDDGKIRFYRKFIFLQMSKETERKHFILHTREEMFEHYGGGKCL